MKISSVMSRDVPRARGPTRRFVMSRSVIMPTSLSFSVTGNRPASLTGVWQATGRSWEKL
jgi:hypothetical protein